MLIVEPAAVRFDQTDPPRQNEEHLLERVSALEFRLTRATEQLERCLDFLLRQARNTCFDHALIETLIETLSENELVDAATIDVLWKERCRRTTEEQIETQRRDVIRTEILACYRGAGEPAFRTLVDNGMKELLDGNVERGIRSLEKAANLDLANTPLNSFLGEHFFRSGKMGWARDYLERTLLSLPDDDRVCLLLGLACGDEGDAERAKQLLRDVVNRGSSCFAAHYALGRLHIAEERWADALIEFKQALTARPSPETHYVVGCAYFRLNRNRLAARHLRKAVAMNSAYSAALHMLGLVLLRSGDKAGAVESFRAARAAGQDESRYRSMPKTSIRPDDVPQLPPLFRAVRTARKRLVTSGDRRLAEVVLEDALNVGLQRTALHE